MYNLRIDTLIKDLHILHWFDFAHLSDSRQRCILPWLIAHVSRQYKPFPIVVSCSNRITQPYCQRRATLCWNRRDRSKRFANKTSSTPTKCPRRICSRISLNYFQYSAVWKRTGSFRYPIIDTEPCTMCNRSNRSCSAGHGTKPKPTTTSTIPHMGAAESKSGGCHKHGGLNDIQYDLSKYSWHRCNNSNVGKEEVTQQEQRLHWTHV